MINHSLWGFVLRDLRGAAGMRSLWVFSACLILGIALIAVCGSLLRLINDGLDQQQRELFGGDLQVSQRAPIGNTEHQWLQTHGDLSLLIELRTMMGTESGQFTVVELQSVDAAYPLYGTVQLKPAISLDDAVALSDDGQWGAAFDPALIEQAGLAVGQSISIGSLQLELRALIQEQPDRSLRADVRGPPVIISEQALAASGLLQPTSLVDYDYRIRTDEDPVMWRERLLSAFPDAEWEVQTVNERGEFVTRRLNQVASVLLLIGFSTLLIGGLGVANSVTAYLQGKLRTLATLQSLGARSSQVASVYLGQVTLLALLASTIGAVLGSLTAWWIAGALADRLPLETGVLHLTLPTVLAVALGVLTALAFALPPLGRTLHSPTASLMRGRADASQTTPRHYRLATAAISILGLLMLIAVVPEPWIAVLFMGIIALLMAILEGIVRGIQHISRKAVQHKTVDGHFSLRMALAGLYRPGTSLRPMLLSLGASLTLLVASASMVAATWQTLSNTVPERSPSLVLYDLQQPQVEDFSRRISALPGHIEHSLAPLVLGRLSAVNGQALSGSTDARRVLEANDEHKLSYRMDGIDNTVVDRGQWWPDNYQGPPLVAMEDREADQLGLQPGDRLTFSILGDIVDAELVAIYSQARLETRFWLEAVFSEGVLDPFISRYIGSARLESGTDIAAQTALAVDFPNVVTVRTAKVLESSRNLLSSAGLAMALIGLVSLVASLLVMASVVAVSRQRQVYEASVLHALGTRMGVIMRSVAVEYALLAVVLCVFALTTGSTIAGLLMSQWLEIDGSGSFRFGAAVAIGASGFCLTAGALWLLMTLKISPATLLRQEAT